MKPPTTSAEMLREARAAHATMRTARPSYHPHADAAILLEALRVIHAGWAGTASTPQLQWAQHVASEALERVGDDGND